MKSVQSPSSNDPFATKLIAWYQTHKRDLPWRESTDPYVIWISEIILQQTRVAQGYDYFLRFMKRFPDLQTLADAQEDEVLKYWQGLGYYSRARNLHAAAKSMNGAFPKTYEGVRALKGVGDYTAAAICSFAYGMPYAVVDGNVYRVLSRYLGIETPIDSTAGKKLFAEAAQELLDKEHPATCNQAVMELGAIQCVPASPDCPVCPLADACVALQQGKVGQLPVKQHKTQTQNRYFNYFYVEAGDCTFIRKRSGNDIWHNLYELPLIETPEEATLTELEATPEYQKLFPQDGKLYPTLLYRGIKHVLSHRVIFANFYEVKLASPTVSLPGYQKIRSEELGEYAVSALIFNFLKKYL